MEVTIKDIAADAKVSVSTVSRVMNGSKAVSDELKHRVMRSIENPKVYYIQDNTTLMMQSTYVPVPEAEEKVYFLWFKIAE